MATELAPFNAPRVMLAQPKGVVVTWKTQSFHSHPDAIKAVNEKTRTIEHLISTQTVDRDGECLRSLGCKTEIFLRNNPIVGWNHSFHFARGAEHELPIGRALDVHVGEEEVSALTEFAGHKQEHPFAARVFLLYRDRFLNSWSVGFSREKETREKLVAGQTGNTVLVWPLVEYSSVALPSNANAITQFMKSLSLPDGATEDDLGKALGTVPLAKYWSIAEQILPTDGTRARGVEGVDTDADIDDLPDFVKIIPPERDDSAAEARVVDDEPPSVNAALVPEPEHAAVSEESSVSTALEIRDGTQGPAFYSPARSGRGTVKSFAGFEEYGYTAPSSGATSPTHVHDYELEGEGDAFESGWAYEVADHKHRITAASLSRGETEASDGHVHALMTAAEVMTALIGTTPLSDLTELAARMFDAYNEQGPNPWKTFDGRDVPRWPDLNDQVRAKWTAVAAMAVKDGRVLSGAHEGKLKTAHGMIGEVLAAHAASRPKDPTAPEIPGQVPHVPAKFDAAALSKEIASRLHATAPADAEIWFDADTLARDLRARLAVHPSHGAAGR